MSITKIRYSTRLLTPASGISSVAHEINMSTSLHHGEHAHIFLTHGTYGVNCSATCRGAGVKEWTP